MERHQTNPAKLKANKRWKHQNKRKNQRYIYKSTCKNFILHWASISDLKDVKYDMIPKRIKVLKKLVK